MSKSQHDRAQKRKRQAAYEARQARRRRESARFTRIAAVMGAVVLAAMGVIIWWASRPEDATGNASVVPPATVAEGRDWDVAIETNQGVIEATLHGADAPQAVSVLVSLIRDGFYDQTDCHRITTSGIYVLQCGDPQGTGSGGPPYRFGPIENDPADDAYPAGTIAMARVGGDAYSMGSQFFVVYQDSTIPSDAAGGYSVVGEVTAGLDIIAKVAEGGTITGATDGRPALSVIITKVTAS